MSISLFLHNEKAYDAAAAMLSQTGRAAVIHPTGTGKSFIGFKLCEDHPEATVCWLSPSEYIFDAQRNNLKKETGGDMLQNIRFYTYARLTYMTDQELKDIAPDIIVLDEFHRCGAEVWGARVETLLSLHKEAQVLGLSATNIRYLDHQRDMAQELFDGNIASEMTLGEAIALGILAAPLYISTVYSYQKELKACERRLQSARYGAVAEQAQQYVEELRRLLERSEGLEEIFATHMTDRTGKYIAFCSNAEHMDEMIAHVPEWFSAIDRTPHIYRVYSEDSAAAAVFHAFCSDKSQHLKLLFCIDMLNEGIHLDDISGVILFRPTVSPIVYKQQIGRALSVGTAGTPVIFDIINNFENLYSLGALEQEMAAAITYYNYIGEGRRIVTDHFKIIGQVQDCLRLFDQLNEALTASWDAMYRHACQYYRQFGHLNVPKQYRNTEGIALGNWINTQRRIRRGDRYGILGAERIEKLDAIGMRWESRSDLAWEKYFGEAVNYYREYGDLNVNARYETPSGIRLGAWLSQLRTCRRSGIRQSYLTADRIQQLDDIGMVWEVPDYLWERNYTEAMIYFRRYGHLDVPVKYTANGVKLGIWMRTLRKARSKGTLSGEQIRRLDDIHMLWKDSYSRAWENGFAHAKEYFAQSGNLNVPTAYTCSDGFALGTWIINQRNARHMPAERKERLDSIGMVWKKTDSWEHRYALARAYYETHGNLNMPADYVIEGIWLSRWLSEQRQTYRGRRQGKTLTEQQIRRLEQIGFSWRDQKEQLWYSYFEELKQHIEAHGTADMPQKQCSQSGRPIGRWLHNQVKYYRAGKLSAQYAELLKSAGVVLDAAQ